MRSALCCPHLLALRGHRPAGRPILRSNTSSAPAVRRGLRCGCARPNPLAPSCALTPFRSPRRGPSLRLYASASGTWVPVPLRGRQRVPLRDDASDHGGSLWARVADVSVLALPRRVSACDRHSSQRLLLRRHVRVRAATGEPAVVARPPSSPVLRSCSAPPLPSVLAVTSCPGQPADVRHCAPALITFNRWYARRIRSRRLAHPRAPGRPTGGGPVGSASHERVGLGGLCRRCRIHNERSACSSRLADATDVLLLGGDRLEEIYPPRSINSSGS